MKKTDHRTQGLSEFQTPEFKGWLEATPFNTSHIRNFASFIVQQETFSIKHKMHTHIGNVISSSLSGS
jgi:hypothetical protein